MRTPKAPLFVVITILSTATALSIACGGKPPETKTPATDTATPSAAPTAADSASGGSTGSTGSTGTTTTTALDAGDLQGAKLESSSHKEIETKGSAGPKAGPGHTQEPGRRREDIQAIIQARREEARACYDKGLKDHPGIEGDLDIQWKIDPQGAVIDASVDTTKSQILEPGVTSCIIEIIKKVKFAPSAKGFETRAHYPFNFHPKTYGGKDAGK